MSAMPGPILPSRLSIWKLAHRIEALARHAKELAEVDSGADLRLALARVDAMRALLGVPIDLACRDSESGPA
ncbi:MAG: hypothetical protein JKX86_07035 [Verrucomicrobiales bacterium]|nr:hypothetical protein [Verrucomicrobiales bacterium]